MADHDWRGAERLALASPDDQHLNARAIAACRRAGVTVPGHLLLRQVFPKRTFQSELPLEVFVERVNKEPSRLGKTPTKKKPLSIPDHHAWWIVENSSVDREHLERTLELVVKESIPGMILGKNGIGYAPALMDDHFDVVGKLAPTITVFGFSYGNTRSLRGVERSGPTPRVLAKLARLERLQRLTLECPWYDRSPLSGLKDMKELAEINLALTQGIDAAALANFPLNLARVRIENAGSVDANAEHLEALEHLIDLTLVNCDITDKGFERIPLEKLEALNVTRTGWGSSPPGITGVSVARLARARYLKRLDLSGSLIQDGALAHLETLRNLTCLALDKCHTITDAGAAHLARLESLRELRLGDCSGISSVGLARLKALSKLERLDVRANVGTRSEQSKGRRALQAALPDCEII
jgi:hypothetical protein